MTAAKNEGKGLVEVPIKEDRTEKDKLYEDSLQRSEKCETSTQLSRRPNV